MSDQYPLSAKIVSRLGGTPDTMAAIGLYATWLASEAVVAGGIGPEEVGRLDNRHLADSLAVAECWHPRQPSSLLDLGSGVGLPGIPLAILCPDTGVTLVDRSERRCRLMRRAVRVLRLRNVEVVRSEAEALTGTFDVVVARGLAGPDRVRELLGRLVAPGGSGVILASRVALVTVPGFSTRSVGEGILDPVSWVLMMDR